MERDPVCGNMIDPASARHLSEYGGKVYRFDSSKCKHDFDSDPAKYISGGGAEKAAKEVREAGRKTAAKSRSFARNVVSGRKSQAADVIGSVSNALHDLSRSLDEKDRHELSRMVDRTAKEADAASSYFRDRDADDIIERIEEFVNDRPGLAIGGALGAGFLAARLIKGDSAWKE
ncbi:MAG: YHS domain-containing protein [Deltaproteobacteria bacterium]|nr:YHS domain-containing protein [Deltaproteobacteria bacterium]MBZ0219699.1 YHS domain-containing protein [Deltaproteobacteria bacterium]